MLTLEEMQALVAQVEFALDGVPYKFEVKLDDDRPYLQASYPELDVSTGEVEIQYTRKWFLSPHMVKSEVVSTAFKCVMTSTEHRTREHFKYRGRRIFGPHFDVDALWEIANKLDALDFRGKETGSATDDSTVENLAE